MLLAWARQPHSAASMCQSPESAYAARCLCYEMSSEGVASMTHDR